MDADASLHARLLHEQVRLLVRNIPALIAGTMLVATGTAGLLLVNHQSWPLVASWLGVMALLCGWRWSLWRRFMRESPSESQAPAWARRMVVASALAGLVWGSLTGLFFSLEDPYTLGVVVMVLASIVASATQSLAPYFPAHLAFGVLVMVPFALRCLLTGEARTVILGLLALAFLVMAELFSKRIAASIEESLRLRFENEALVAEVSRARDAAEAASRAKTRFLATASHDLRQPIHAMGLFVPALQTMARREHVAPQALGAVADRMHLALQTMGQLLGRLLDVSRLDAGVVEVKSRAVALAPLIETAVDEVTTTARGKGLTIRVREPGLWVQSDPAVLHAILSNLLGNAVRYTHKGGILRAARRRGDQVLLQVWDTGIGIAQSDQGRLSEEFFQGGNAHEDATQSRGFGLGLAIAQRSARLLGTSLRWRSRLGRGSVFELPLPWAPANQTAADPSAAPERPPVPQATDESPLVLVVDQDEDILASMAFLLKVWGFPALLARTMDDVRAQIEEHGHRIAGALVDIHLAPGINGLTVAALLREGIHPELPLAIVTGDTTPEVMAAVRSARLVLLHKPAHAQAVHAFVATTRASAG